MDASENGLENAPKSSETVRTGPKTIQKRSENGPKRSEKALEPGSVVDRYQGFALSYKSNFNWPGLGHRRVVPSVRAVLPQPWPIEINFFY